MASYCHVCDEQTDNTWICDVCYDRGWLDLLVMRTGIISSIISTEARRSRTEPRIAELEEDLRLAVLRRQYLTSNRRMQVWTTKNLP